MQKSNGGQSRRYFQSHLIERQLASGSITNISASFEQGIGEIRERAGRDEAENRRGMKGEKEKI